jgi:hypothetical protein
MLVMVCARMLGAGLALAAWASSQTPPASELEKAVEEFRVQTRILGLRSDSPAHVRGGGASFSKWHGRLFENFRNDFLDAVPHEVVQRGGSRRRLRRNQFGFNVSGPVVIPKLLHGGSNTFFSLSYEAMRESIDRTYLRTIPTPGERTGDWTHVVDQAGERLPIYDPATTIANPSFHASEPVSVDNLQYSRSPFAGNRIPASRLDPAAQWALQYYPEPNTDAGPFFSNNYFIQAPEVSRADGFILRIDHNVRERHRLRFGWNVSNGADGAAAWFPTIADPGPVPRDRRNRRFSFDHVFTLSSRTVNTLSVEAYTDQTENRPGLDDSGSSFPLYSFTPYLSMGRPYPISRNTRNVFSLSNGLSTRWNEHRFRVVAELSREQLNSFWPQYPSGRFRFSSGLTSLPGIVNTGHAFASFLLGGADFVEQSYVMAPSYFRRTRGTVVLRDAWEIRTGLTLNLGVNLDANGPRVEKYDRQSTIAFDEVNPANGRPGALAAAMHDGHGRTFQPVTARLEPSASLAWNMLGNARSVLRMAWSRSYSPIPVYLGQWGTQGFNGTPTWVSSNAQLEPAVVLSAPLPAPDRELPDLRPDAVNNTVADLVEPTGRQPTYQSVSVSLERELPGQLVLSTGLSHAYGRNLLLGNGSANPNAISLDALAYRDRLNDENFNRSLRPFPHYQRFNVNSAWPEGRYKRNAGWLRLEKRTSAGLSLSAYYEASKQMDDYSGPYGVQDYYNRYNEWSLTAYNNPHRFSLTYMYELPLGPNRVLLPATDWRRHLAEGWSISGVTSVSSGEPLALRPQFNNTGGVIDSLMVNVVPGVNPYVADPGPDLWFNPEAFSHPADFTTGNASRTHPTLRRPGTQNLDLSLTKRFVVSPEHSIEFSAVGFNFINHANWTDPDMVIGTEDSPNLNAGKIIGSQGGRVIQLGVRFSF